MLSRLSTASLLSLPLLAVCQDGYSGYKLGVRQDGDPAAVLYETANTATSNVSALFPVPDVLLNASVHVGEISIGVDNLTAKINLDAQVLQLLQFNAGVDLNIDKVTLLIQNVTAKVYLEARLSNLVKMISNVLDSIDLNPVIAELGNGLGSIINETAGLVTDAGTQPSGNEPAAAAANEKRNLDLHQWHLTNNILYTTTNFQASTHQRRTLAQDGAIIQTTLNNAGEEISAPVVVGSYARDMRFTGFNKSVLFDGREAREEEYVYEPFAGLYSVAAVFLEVGSGEVVGTRLLGEVRGGGSADIGLEGE
ncbi:hypothetical protein J1614_008151 [Plenodomus biglobosus]|nr:hypothetical protein J1614_008151 [Plenodomus biglobosus]